MMCYQETPSQSPSLWGRVSGGGSLHLGHDLDVGYGEVEGGGRLPGFISGV